MVDHKLDLMLHESTNGLEPLDNDYVVPEETANSGASKSAIKYHYDVGNEFYRLWLDHGLVYSAARWSDPISGLDVADTLEAAQRAKIDFHLNAISVKPGDSLLDIGCGWGALLVDAVTRYGASRATGLTLSDEQYNMIKQKNHEKIEVHLQSHEHFLPKETYDCAVSIGAFEHFVRPEMNKEERIAIYGRFFSRIADSLRPKGRLSLQTICWSDIGQDYARHIVPVDVFPESDLPYLPEVYIAACDRFTPIYMENNASDYVRTLDHWLIRLRRAKSEITACQGGDVYNFYERYLRTSIIGFKTNRTSLARFVLQKK